MIETDGNEVDWAEGGVRLIGAERAAPILLVCEHGGNVIPQRYGDLGLTGEVRLSHAAWDPGALDVAMAMADLLDAPLVAQSTSRLVYDCNRPTHSQDAIRATSEVYAIPGNVDLTDAARAERTETVYQPFEAAIARACDDLGARAGRAGAVVTVHTFTPVFHGHRRSVEIGALHGDDCRLANAFLAIAGADRGHDVRRNAPYGPADGVLHTLQTHAVPRGLPHLMLEIRNDLVASPAASGAMAERLSRWLSHAIAHITEPDAV